MLVGEMTNSRHKFGRQYRIRVNRLTKWSTNRDSTAAVVVVVN